jgi:hypothetical protein
MELVQDISPSLGNEARAMAESYVILHALENALREFVRERLKEKYGAEWWDRGVPQRIKTSTERNKLKELSSPWHDVKPADMPSYTTFEDLQGIIQSNWDIFDRYFHDQAALVGRLKELEIPRNTIVHNRILEDSEIERLRLFAHDVFKCIAPG